MQTELEKRISGVGEIIECLSGAYYKELKDKDARIKELEEELEQGREQYEELEEENNELREKIDEYEIETSN